MSTSEHVTDVVVPWPELVSLLVLLVCADAKERELFYIARVPEPTYIQFGGYLLLTCVWLAMFSLFEPEHHLHPVQLVMLNGSWILFWIFHREWLAFLLSVLAIVVCIVMAVQIKRPELLLWTCYLALHSYGIWHFKQSIQDVRFPGRSVSRFSTPAEPPGSNANSYVLPVQNLVSLTREINKP